MFLLVILIFNYFFAFLNNCKRLVNLMSHICNSACVLFKKLSYKKRLFNFRSAQMLYYFFVQGNEFVRTSLFRCQSVIDTSYIFVKGFFFSRTTISPGVREIFIIIFLLRNHYTFYSTIYRAYFKHSRRLCIIQFVKLQFLSRLIGKIAT